MPVPCRTGCGKTAVLKRPKTGDTLCKECFFWAFETEIHYTITKGQLFKPGDSVAIGASGGKDSTVLAFVLKTLNQRYKYGLNLMLLSIDEGITGYRDDSLETVKQNRDDYDMPLKILSYKDLYGWTMDEIVAQIGRKNNCTFCGVFRRQALDRGAAMLGVRCIATGHNADDIAETVLMNVLRGDIARLKRCTAISTGSEGAIPRVKPLKYTYEKEIVMYAHYKKLVYFSTECVFAPNAYRGHARALLKDLEKIRPSCIMDIIYSGETMGIKEQVSLPSQRICSRCKFVSSQEVCKACVLLEGLNKGLPKLGIGKTSKAKRMLEEYARRDDQGSLKDAIDELNSEIYNTSICRSKTKSCKSGLCKSDQETINGKLNSDENFESNNEVGSNNCKNKCSGTCSGNVTAVDGAAQGESKIKTLLKEYGLENSEKSMTTLQVGGERDDKENTGQSNSSDEDELIKDDETCLEGCGGMGSVGVSF